MKKQIKKLTVQLYFIAIAVLFVGVGINHIEPKAIAYSTEPKPYPVIFDIQYDWTTERIKQEIDEVALEYGVSAKVMNTVIACESQYKKEALGDGGKSRGLAQIHSGYHNVSDEDAYNPKYAIRFLAQNLKDGKGNLWSCYNKFYSE